MTFQDQWLMYIYMNQSGYKKEVNSCVFNQNILKISKKQTWGSANTFFMLLIGPYGTPLPSKSCNHLLVISSLNLGTD